MCAYVKYLLSIENEIKRMGLFEFYAFHLIFEMMLEIVSRI